MLYTAYSQLQHKIELQHCPTTNSNNYKGQIDCREGYNPHNLPLLARLPNHAPADWTGPPYGINLGNHQHTQNIEERPLHLVTNEIRCSWYRFPTTAHPQHTLNTVQELYNLACTFLKPYKLTCLQRDVEFHGIRGMLHRRTHDSFSTRSQTLLAEDESPSRRILSRPQTVDCA